MLRLPSSLQSLAKTPVSERDVSFALSKDNMICEICVSEFTFQKKDFVFKEMKMIPPTIEVINYYQNIYTCEKCNSNSRYIDIITPAIPSPLLKNSLVSPAS